MGNRKQDSWSPKGVLEDYLSRLESETSSSKEGTSNTPNPEISRSSWNGLIQLLRTQSQRHLPTFKFSLRKCSSMKFSKPNNGDTASCSGTGWKNFTLSELQKATNNFSHENLIGKGGYSEVYKGNLKDGQLVAIKKLVRGNLEDRTSVFLCELGIMAHVRHPNTAKLIGYGVEGGMHLVLELSPRGNLSSLLHGSKVKLKWSIRYKIALGVAEGLLYLHEGCQRRIIHRDIKAANILLSQDFRPQICDFGLAKWLPEHWSHHTLSGFEGTYGYLAPEYLMHGIVDEKTDVYAFGVLLLELISGRRALNYLQQILVNWAKPLLEKNDIHELVDPFLIDDKYDSQQMNLVLVAASLCIQKSSLQRPQMSLVVKILKGDFGSLQGLRKRRGVVVKASVRRALSSRR